MDAGLEAHTDYIVGLEPPYDSIAALAEDRNMRPIHLYVYSTITRQCRSVVLVPNRSWGGEGR